MANLNFPATPNNGDSYTANDIVYIWDGAKWTAGSPSSYDTRYVNVAGDTMTGDLTVPSLNGGQLAGFRNKLINGDFRVWARGTTVTNAGAATYTADRWKETGSTVGATVIQRNAGPNNIGYSAKTSANSGSLQQSIELDRQGNNSQFGVGSTWTMSVWSDQDLTTETPWARFRRSSSVTTGQREASNTFNNWQLTGETSKGFTRYFHTFTIDYEVSGSGAPAGDADITCLTVVLPSGATFGAITSYTGAQLEPGPVATPFEHRPIGTELALCQRYYQKRSVGTIARADLRPSMRAAPTVTGSNYDAEL